MKNHSIRNPFFMALTLCAFGLSACAQSPRGNGTQVDRSVAYTTFETAQGEKSYALDMVRPSAECPALRPTVIMIHGGGFIGGQRSTKTHQKFARSFAQRGWNSASISYPLAGDKPQPSAEFLALQTMGGDLEERFEGQFIAAIAAIEAAADAMTFFVRNNEQYCTDPDHIFLLGSSAGAIAAISATYALDDSGISTPRPAGVIDYWGGLPINIMVMNDTDAPLFIVHGTNDRTVPFSMAEDLFERAEQTSTPAQLHAFRGKGHGWGQINGQSRIGTQTVEDAMISWMETILSGQIPETLRTIN